MFDHFWNLLINQLNNQFFTGGTLVVLIGAFLASMRNVPNYLLQLLKRRFVVTIDVSDTDLIFFWLKKWLTEKSKLGEKSNLVTVTSVNTIKNYVNEQDNTLLFSPAPGYHIIKFKNSYILLHTDRRELSISFSSGDNHKPYVDTITLMSFNRKIIIDFLEEARDLFYPKTKKLKIYRAETYYSDVWVNFVERSKRDINSVILHKNIKKDLIQDLQNFQKQEQRYTDLGIPYQRGYIFYGPPGNGKTSTIVSLAGYLNLDIYYLSLNGINNNNITKIIAGVKRDGILVIEDIDCIFDKRKNTSDDKTSNLSFSTLLNALDGINNVFGRILIITTNHIEKLDSALLRPGRIDKKILFDNPDYLMAKQLFLKFFPNEEKYAENFAEQVKSQNNKYSMVDLQEHLLKYQDDAEKATTLITNGFKEVKQKEVVN